MLFRSGDIANDPHLRERGFFQRIWLEQLGAELEVMRAPFVSSGYEMKAKPPPALGQHSRALLEELCGMDAETMSSLIDRGIVGVAHAGVRA